MVKTKELVGFTKLYDINWIHQYAHFGIVIGEKQVRCNVIGKETTQMMIRYAFDDLNLNKIVLEVIEKNESAIKLYQHIGFKIEGNLKKHVFINGFYNDADGCIVGAQSVINKKYNKKIVFLLDSLQKLSKIG
ncbi:MAG: GNAT family N-acetyltransferase [Candidatus Delongbacteria bacterium]|nr:GNAT family N-acetyltransferase [Candidatus Delongbacteria bacterium]